jgi:hypothetical protein
MEKEGNKKKEKRKEVQKGNKRIRKGIERMNRKVRGIRDKGGVDGR